MYCYRCAKEGKIRYVTDGYRTCLIGHSVHVNLDQEVELPSLIQSIKDRKIDSGMDGIREFIKRERQGRLET